MNPSPRDPSSGPVGGSAGAGGLLDAAARPGAILQTFRAVAWSFFGIRRSSDYERDVARLNPVHVVVAGIVGALVFVGALVLLVNWVVASSGAH